MPPSRPRESSHNSSASEKESAHIFFAVEAKMHRRAIKFHAPICEQQLALKAEQFSQKASSRAMTAAR
jgi:hypothetical protein